MRHVISWVALTSLLFAPVAQAQTLNRRLVLGVPVDSVVLPSNQVIVGTDTLTTALSGKAATDLSNAPATNQSLNQGITVQPLANTITTKASRVSSATAASTTTREFVNVNQFTVNAGAGQTGDVGNKVWDYTGIMINPGAGGVWSRNDQIQINPGAIASGWPGLQGHEIDIENTDTQDVSDLGLHSAYAFAVGSGAVNRKAISAGFVIGTAFANAWRGFVCLPGVATACFSDNGNSATSVFIGGTHAWGVNCSNGTFSVACLFLGNNQPIAAVTADGSTSKPIAKLDTGNNLILGDLTNSNYTVVAGHVTFQQAIDVSFKVSTPASSSATCTPGMFAADANYFYFCPATNTWKRTALATF